MMLPTDYVMVSDKSFRKYAKAYAEDQDLFFKEYVIYNFQISHSFKLIHRSSLSFSKAFATLLELGVPDNQFVSTEPWTLKNSDENWIPVSDVTHFEDGRC